MKTKAGHKAMRKEWCRGVARDAAREARMDEQRLQELLKEKGGIE